MAKRTIADRLNERAREVDRALDRVLARPLRAPGEPEVVFLDKIGLEAVALAQREHARLTQAATAQFLRTLEVAWESAKKAPAPRNGTVDLVYDAAGNLTGISWTPPAAKPPAAAPAPDAKPPSSSAEEAK